MRLFSDDAEQSYADEYGSTTGRNVLHVAPI